MAYPRWHEMLTITEPQFQSQLQPPPPDCPYSWYVSHPRKAIRVWRVTWRKLKPSSFSYVCMSCRKLWCWTPPHTPPPGFAVIPFHSMISSCQASALKPRRIQTEWNCCCASCSSAVWQHPHQDIITAPGVCGMLSLAIFRLLFQDNVLYLSDGVGESSCWDYILL